VKVGSTAIALLFVVSLYAHESRADIASFNAALRAGDLDGAATAAEAAWSTWNHSHPQTALIAREFGFVSLRAGRFDAAADFARFLVADGDRLPHPDEQPEISLVLLRAAELRLDDGRRQRTALRTALEARMSAPDVDLISLLAWEWLYSAHWNAGDWRAAADMAAQTVVFAQREPRELIVPRFRAELVQTAARFLSLRDRSGRARDDAYEALIDLHDRIAAAIDAEDNEVRRDALWTFLWRARAWTGSAYAYMASLEDGGTGTLIRRQMPGRPEFRRPTVPQMASVRYDRPLCEGELTGDPPHYPSSALYRDVIGTSIVRLRTDESGFVIDAEELATVPAAHFAEAVIAAVGRWRYVPAAGIDTAACRLDHDNFVQQVIFVIH
jgi:tetratricopeptide (TPR) repeat protein